MTFTVPRTLLAPALARAAAVTPGRTTMPITECALIEAGDAGLSITTTSLDLMYREQVDTEAASELGEDPPCRSAFAARRHHSGRQLTEGAQAVDLGTGGYVRTLQLPRRR